MPANDGPDSAHSSVRDRIVRKPTRIRDRSRTRTGDRAPVAVIARPFASGKNPGSSARGPILVEVPGNPSRRPGESRPRMTSATKIQSPYPPMLPPTCRGATGRCRERSSAAAQEHGAGRSSSRRLAQIERPGTGSRVPFAPGTTTPLPPRPAIPRSRRSENETFQEPPCWIRVSKGQFCSFANEGKL